MRIDDTTTDVRWPRWNEAAARLGVRSVLSAPLLVSEESTGAMKVDSERPANYGAHDEHVIRLLAGQAAILLANAQNLAEARRISPAVHRGAGQSRRYRRGHRRAARPGAASEQDAFATLATAARQADRSVQDMAQALVAAVVARTTGPPGA